MNDSASIERSEFRRIIENAGDDPKAIAAALQGIFDSAAEDKT